MMPEDLQFLRDIYDPDNCDKDIPVLHEKRKQLLLQSVLHNSKELLLQMASPDSLIRVQCTDLRDEQKKLCQIYFEHQKHDSLTEFMENQLEFANDEGILVQVRRKKVIFCKTIMIVH